MEAKGNLEDERIARFLSLPPGYLLTLPAAQQLAGGSETLRELLEEGLIRKQRGGKFSFEPPWTKSTESE